MICMSRRPGAAGSSRSRTLSRGAPGSSQSAHWSRATIIGIRSCRWPRSSWAAVVITVQVQRNRSGSSSARSGSRQISYSPAIARTPPSRGWM